MKLFISCVFVVFMFPSLLFAQNPRPACVLMSAVDLKPLLGADHAPPVPYADVGCITKSKTPGRLVLLFVVEKPNAELKKYLAADKKQLSTAEYAKVGTLTAAPEFGPEAFFAREKGEQSAAEIRALKGTHAINVTLNWSKGPINETIFKQLRELTASVLLKLP